MELSGLQTVTKPKPSAQKVARKVRLFVGKKTVQKSQFVKRLKLTDYSGTHCISYKFKKVNFSSLEWRRQGGEDDIGAFSPEILSKH